MFPHLPSFDPRYFQQLPTDRLLHSRVLPTAHLLGVPPPHRPGAGPPLPCRSPLLLERNCSPVHPWLPSPHHPCQCRTPSKSSCSPNPGIKEMFLVDLYNLTNLLTTEPEHPTGIEQQGCAGRFLLSLYSEKELV